MSVLVSFLVVGHMCLAGHECTCVLPASMHMCMAGHVCICVLPVCRPYDLAVHECTCVLPACMLHVSSRSCVNLCPTYL